jgi:hypothetical protein
MGGSMLKWPEHDPNEVLDYELDWADPDEPRLQTGETLLTSVWSVVEGDVVIDQGLTTFTAARAVDGVAEAGHARHQVRAAQPGDHIYSAALLRQGSRAAGEGPLMQGAARRPTGIGDPRRLQGHEEHGLARAARTRRPRARDQRRHRRRRSAAPPPRLRAQAAGSWHSVRTFTLKVLGVCNGILGVVRDDFSFLSLGVFVGMDRVAYTEVNGDIYFCNNAASGVVKVDDTTGAVGHHQRPRSVAFTSDRRDADAGSGRRAADRRPDPRQLHRGLQGTHLSRRWQDALGHRALPLPPRQPHPRLHAVRGRHHAGDGRR